MSLAAASMLPLRKSDMSRAAESGPVGAAIGVFILSLARCEIVWHIVQASSPSYHQRASGITKSRTSFRTGENTMHSRINGAFARLTSFAMAAGLLAMSTSGRAQAVEYVRICSQFGAGYNYLPGTDICHNQATGEAGVLTEGGALVSR